MINKSDRSSIFDSFLSTMERTGSLKKFAGTDDIVPLLAKVFRGVTEITPDAAKTISQGAKGSKKLTHAEYLLKYFDDVSPSPLFKGPSSYAKLQKVLGGFDSISSKINGSQINMQRLRGAIQSEGQTEKFVVHLLGRQAKSGGNITEDMVRLALGDAKIPASKWSKIARAISGPTDEALATAAKAADDLAEAEALAARATGAAKIKADDVVAARKRLVDASKKYADDMSDVNKANMDSAAAEVARARTALDDAVVGLSDEAAKLTDDMADAAKLNADEVSNLNKKISNLDDKLRGATGTHREDLLKLRESHLKDLHKANMRATRAGNYGAHFMAGGLGRSLVGGAVKLTFVAAAVMGIYYLGGKKLIDWLTGLFTSTWAGKDAKDGVPNPHALISAAGGYSGCDSRVDVAISKLESVEFNAPEHGAEYRALVADLKVKKDSLDDIIAIGQVDPSKITVEMAESALSRAAVIHGSVSSIINFIEDKGETARKEVKGPGGTWDHAVSAVRDLMTCLDVEAEKLIRAYSSSSGSVHSSSAANPNSVYSPLKRVVAVKVNLTYPIIFDEYEVSFVNIPRVRTKYIKTEADLRIEAPTITVALNEAVGKALFERELISLKIGKERGAPELQVPLSHLVQYAANRAAYELIKTDAFKDRGASRDLVEGNLGRFFERAKAKGAEGSGGFFRGRGWKKRREKAQMEDAERRMERQMRPAAAAPSGPARRITETPEAQGGPAPIEDDGVVAIGSGGIMSSRIKELRKFALVAMSDDKKISTIKVDREGNLNKIADEHTKSYYKDALTGQNNDDKYMKAYYAGLRGMHDESLEKRKADYKEYFILHDETGEDLIHAAHPKAIVVSDAIGRGGLVENGLEQKRQSHGVAMSTPTGNYRANYAWLQNKSIIKK